MLKHLEKQSGILILLTEILRRNEVCVTDIIHKIKLNPTSTYKALNKLKSLKLVKETRQNHFPNKRLFKLTDKGKKVAEKLVEIEEILEKG